MVDPEREAGFKTARWAQRIVAKGPLAIDPVSKALWAYESGVWREARDVIDVRLPAMMGDSFRRGDVAHVETYLYSRLLADGTVIRPGDPDTEHVSVPSGLFEIATGKMLDHDPGVMSLYQLQVDPVFNAPTPEFDQFLETSLHPDDWERMLDILAYLLLPGNPWQRAVMFTGRGRNGKGVLIHLLESLVGTQNTATVSLQEMGTQFAAADLYGKALNIVGDIDGDHIANTGKFKQMTGGDTVRMDVKHGKAFASKVWAVPVFSANQIPTSADTSHGYLRRWEVVEFPNTFDGTDTELAYRLLAELPAIAGVLLQHAAKAPYEIRETDSGRRAHDTFANRSDPVRSWLLESELDGFVERKDAYTDYKLWIDDGNGKTALTKTNFYSRVSAVLGDPKTVKGARGWHFAS